MNKIYITTTLPYANSVPHVGHALEFFQGDALARFFRKKYGDENVFFNVGIDENGLKLFNTAKDNNKTPQDFVNELSLKWKDFCLQFNISYNCFYRTSEKVHHLNAKMIWSQCNENGDIYKRHYDGLYCVGCESFILERDLLNGDCPHHNEKPVIHSEENYFFRLSKYSSQILEYLENSPSFLQPKSKLQELKNFIKNIEDISISRSKENLPWGVDVPDDQNHVMYVWFDALTNYISAIGYNSDPNNFNKFWPGVQLCGPDNLRFQGAMWQGILASLNLPFTKHLLVHGTVLGPDGQKMSKSIGNVIAPLDQYEKYGSDVCRYYMLAIIKTYNDCCYRESELKEFYNSNLANNYGNLLYRFIHLAQKKEINIANEDVVESSFRQNVLELKNKSEGQYTNFGISDAALTINKMITFGNQYFHKEEPWKQDTERCEIILNGISFLLKIASELYYPIIPDGAQKALNALEKKEKIILFPKLD
ncbi:MAG: methionine--tRNA ligase [Planctomycetia bacterium]|nr:methionine--tRNA ligase [Planctomycetia bacterium]